jgi:hypothetical protein
MALPPDDLRLGRLTDRAGVDDDEISHVHRTRLGATSREQAPGHLLRVALVHLAAQRPDEEPRQGRCVRAEFREALVVRRERIARARGRDRRRDEVEHGQRAGRRAERHGSGMVRRRQRVPREHVPVGDWDSPTISGWSF